VPLALHSARTAKENRSVVEEIIALWKRATPAEKASLRDILLGSC
jgi:hypothetical protein